MRCVGHVEQVELEKHGQRFSVNVKDRGHPEDQNTTLNNKESINKLVLD
jgi:hypothetical protein